MNGLDAQITIAGTGSQRCEDFALAANTRLVTDYMMFAAPNQHKGERHEGLRARTINT